MHESLTTLRAALGEATALGDIDGAAGAFARALGYAHHLLAWTRLPPDASGFIERSEAVGTIAPEWLDRFWLRRYHEDDCVVGTCLGSVLPVTWTGTPPAPLTRRQRRIAREAARFGLTAGVAVPIRAPAGLFGLFIVARFRDPHGEHPRDVVDALALGAMNLIETTARLVPSPAAGPVPPPLKPIERECLLWAARGYQTAQIGEKLGLRERTVTFHVGNAMNTLGASSRIQAVAMAVQFGLIEPRLVHTIKRL
ncbi:MAG: LuxR family transcriptional regulator, partial [Alphaproteobacteria bacterium]|nr:LuxR family transcriptional regulator [Alphaproteobacteria bacterium]